MSRRVRFLPAAESDLDEQFLYLSARDTDLEAGFLTQTRTTCEKLADNPELGIRYSSLHPRLTDIRVWKIDRFPRHLILYRPVSGTVEIVRILHSARDIEGLFDRGEIG
jgi:toxin ParE1/3/4